MEANLNVGGGRKIAVRSNLTAPEATSAALADAIAVLDDPANDGTKAAELAQAILTLVAFGPTTATRAAAGTLMRRVVRDPETREIIGSLEVPVVLADA